MPSQLPLQASETSFLRFPGESPMRLRKQQEQLLQDGRQELQLQLGAALSLVWVQRPSG